MDNSFDKLINRVLDGRYKILNVLGIGGMAYVLKATDLQNDNRTVAIKILNDECNSDERAVKRFINESEAVSMISAPNIVKIYDVAISDTLKYIVMEYIDGITLKDYIDKVGALGWKEAVHYVKQILAGLSSAHEKDIIHRDVKPQNIMLLKDGHVKVTDFGIAKMPTSEPITMTDKAIGTVNYISPEQASGGKVDFKSDIYSTGVMLYEMVTGVLPFTAESPVAVAMMQVSNDPVSPREINPNIPIGLEQIILKAMSKDPDARFTSATAMMKALDYFVKNPTIVFAQAQSGSSSASTRNKPIDTVQDNKKKKRTSKPMYPIVLGITLAFFTVAVASGIFLAVNSDVSASDGFSLFDKLLGYEDNSDANRKMSVESFTERLYDDELKAELESKGYSVEVKYVRNEAKPQNTILNQDPEAGDTRIKPENGKKIALTLYVNMGNVETKMPDCIMIASETAIAYLQNEFNAVLMDGYNAENIKVEEHFSETVPKGFVIETLPASDTSITVTKDLKITMYVSKGPERSSVVMPHVVGKTLAEAKRLIVENGLSLGDVENVDSNEYPQGYVTWSSVEEGSEVQVATTSVSLKVSRGKAVVIDTPESTTVPDNTEKKPVTTGDNTQGSGEITPEQTPSNDDSQSTPEQTTPPTDDTQSVENTQQSNDTPDDGGLDALLGMRGEQ